MQTFLVMAVLAAGPSQTEVYTSSSEAAAALCDELPTGTLLFSTGDCLAVRIYTQSPYTHVAAVVVRDGQPFVYDSQNGVGVRCLPLEEYLRAQSPNPVHVCRPKRPFSSRRATLFLEHLERELGRSYEVKHHLTGARAEGVHCAEYITDALMHCRLMHAHRPSKVSPASLRDGILEGHVYDEVRTVEIRVPRPPEPEADGWCEQLWIDTKTCTSNCCRQMGRWFLCW